MHIFTNRLALCQLCQWSNSQQPCLQAEERVTAASRYVEQLLAQLSTEEQPFDVSCVSACIACIQSSQL
jgi:hypothetical protein